MKNKFAFTLFAIPTVVFLTVVSIALANDVGNQDLDISDGHYVIMELGQSAVGGFTVLTDTTYIAQSMPPPSMLNRWDYTKVYSEAKRLLDEGMTFRTSIVIAPASTITDPLKNYENWNAETYFYAFCADYDMINEQGYCPITGPLDHPTIPNAARENYRNKFVRARDLFAFLSLAEPTEMTINVKDSNGVSGSHNIRQLGREGVLIATREIANVHMTFGNEFMVDALEYRFSAGDDTSADEIIATEIAQLELALQQFSLGVDVLAHAFNADIGGAFGAYIGDYFTEREFELFGIVSERMVMTIDEVALRYRQLGKNDAALALYEQGFTAQYAQALALAYKAQERDADFLNNGGWEMMTNLGHMRAMAQGIHDNINPFGFVDDYIPVHTYDKLFNETQQQFLRDAEEDEDEAQNAQREFDHNKTALLQELRNLRDTYDAQLLELCGASEDDYRTCEGGLMEQNRYEMIAAAKRIDLACQRIVHNYEKIRIEEERAGQVIKVTFQNGQMMAALSYAAGVINSERTTQSIVNSTSEEWYQGTENKTVRSKHFSVGFSLGSLWGFIASGGKQAPLDLSFGNNITKQFSEFSGYRHSQSKTNSISKVWDPDQRILGFLNSIRDLQQTAKEMEITAANSEAVIRNLFLEQADLMIELDLAINEWNRLAAEHDHLVEKYTNLLNLRAQAQEDLNESYLNNPAYRILRDRWTIEAARSHGKAAQFAYLTAKALEYEFLTPVPFIGDIYKARTADDIDNFLVDLDQWQLALGNPGHLNRYPYKISIANDLLGLSNENLDPDNSMTASERAQLRYELFQEFLQSNTITGTVLPGTDIISGTDITSGTVEFHFTTSLLDGNIFSPNIWNNRIAGVGLPENVPGTQGIRVNILTRQLGDPGTPEIILKHGGQASYRNSDNQIAEYTIGRTMLVGYAIPQSFQDKDTSAVIVCSVNGNGQGSPNSALFNLSVAASNWTVRIDPSSYYNQDLDISQLEDIEILMDTTGIALSGRQKAAQMDSLRLRSEFDGISLEQLLEQESLE